MARTAFEENEVFCILNSIPGMSLDNFNDRMRFQKIGYLAQKIGAKGRFPFSWYIHGPYSGSLTKMLYRADYLDILDGRHNATPREQEIIEKMKQLMGSDSLEDPRQLELYASVWYLLRGGSITDLDIRRVVEAMKVRKPQFEESRVRECIDNIKKHVESISQ